MDLAVILKGLLLFCCCVAMATGQEEEEMWKTSDFQAEARQTLHIVFHTYIKLMRPPEKFVEVKVAVKLRHIRSLDIHRQELQAVYDIDLDWFDSRLQWQPNKIKTVIVNASSIWIPDVVLGNLIQPAQKLYTPDTVRINYDGQVWWSRKELITTSCPIKPYERVYDCPLKFGFKSKQRNDQNDRFFSEDNVVSVADDFTNMIWQVVGNASVETDGTNETQPSVVTFTFPLESNSLISQSHDDTSAATQYRPTTWEKSSAQVSAVSGNTASTSVAPQLLFGLSFVIISLCQHILRR